MIRLALNTPLQWFVRCLDGLAASLGFFVVPKIGQFANKQGKLYLPMAVWLLTLVKLLSAFNRQVAGSL